MTHTPQAPTHTTNLNTIGPTVPEIQKRGVHVRTCRDTPPVTTAYAAVNGIAIACQLSNQSAEPLPSNSRRNICDTPQAARARCHNIGTDMIRYLSHARQEGWGYPPKRTACQSGLRFQRYKPLKTVTTAGSSYSDFWCMSAETRFALRARLLRLFSCLCNCFKE